MYSGGIEWELWPEFGKAIKFKLRNTRRPLGYENSRLLLIVNMKGFSRDRFPG